MLRAHATDAFSLGLPNHVNNATHNVDDAKNEAISNATV